MTNPQIGVMLTLETIDPGVARDDRPNSLASSASDPMPTGVAGGCVKPDRGVLVVCAPLAVELYSGGGIAPGDEIAVDIHERVRVASAGEWSCAIALDEGAVIGERFVAKLISPRVVR